MSLLEWIGERRSPGPLGTIEHQEPDPGHWSPRIIVVRAVIAAVMLAAAIAWVVGAISSERDTGYALLALGIYCSIAYWVSPRPDYENVGLVGGVIDHPFRWSDDYNRLLVFVKVVLWPGRFVVVSIRDLLRLMRSRRTLVLPSRDE
jgi:hypothetical protein